MPDEDDPLINRHEIAELLGIAKGTLDGYISRGHPRGNPFPPFEARDHATGVQLWRRSTVLAWHQRRAGRGARTDRT